MGRLKIYGRLESPWVRNRDQFGWDLDDLKLINIHCFDTGFFLTSLIRALILLFSKLIHIWWKLIQKRYQKLIFHTHKICEKYKFSKGNESNIEGKWTRKTMKLIFIRWVSSENKEVIFFKAKKVEKQWIIFLRQKRLLNVLCNFFFPTREQKNASFSKDFFGSRTTFRNERNGTKGVKGRGVWSGGLWSPERRPGSPLGVAEAEDVTARCSRRSDPKRL